MGLSLRNRIRTGEVLISDGATGTNLFARGLPRGVPGEAWVLERPDQIIQLHRDFIDAGADILLTCTFGASPIRLAGSDLEGKAIEINQKAVALAQQAAQGRSVFIGASIGPSGKLMKPYGPLDEGEAFDSFLEQMSILVKEGIDLLAIETQFSLEEARVAVKAAHTAGNIPVVCSFSFDRGTRTMMGVKPAQVAQELEDLELDLLGINCGRSLGENLENLKALRQATKRPIWFKPNAGIPEVKEDGQASYTVTPEMMGQSALEWIPAGASVVGGCCGTTPEHLQAIAGQIRKQP